MLVTQSVIDQILLYSNLYRQKVLSGSPSPDVLLSDWWTELRFFFSKAFYQGRRDVVSDRVFAAAMTVLEPLMAVGLCFYVNFKNSS